MEVQILKRKLPGFRTSLNNKSKSALLLAQQVKGPPVNRAPIMLSQLKSQLSDITTTYQKMVEIIDEILSMVVKDDDQSQFTHYTGYKETVSNDFEDTRLQLTLTIALIEKIPEKIVEETVVDSGDDDDDEEGGSGNKTAAPIVRARAVTDLKPFVLKRSHKPTQFAVWAR